MIKNRFVLSIGSNMGDRDSSIRKAVDFLSSLGTVESVSSLYETSPVGMAPGTDHFFNLVMGICSDFTPNEMLALVKEYEKKKGRDTVNSHMKPRIIDIDILFAGNLIMNTTKLTLPHPELGNRKFVLAPLSEILPDLVHPVSGKTVSELLNELRSDEVVRRIEFPGGEGRVKI